MEENWLSRFTLADHAVNIFNANTAKTVDECQFTPFLSEDSAVERNFIWLFLTSVDVCALHHNGKGLLIPKIINLVQGVVK